MSFTASTALPSPEGGSYLVTVEQSGSASIEATMDIEGTSPTMEGRGSEGLSESGTFSGEGKGAGSGATGGVEFAVFDEDPRVLHEERQGAVRKPRQLLLFLALFALPSCVGLPLALVAGGAVRFTAQLSIGMVLVGAIGCVVLHRWRLHNICVWARTQYVAASSLDDGDILRLDCAGLRQSTATLSLI